MGIGLFILFWGIFGARAIGRLFCATAGLGFRATSIRILFFCASSSCVY